MRGAGVLIVCVLGALPPHLALAQDSGSPPATPASSPAVALLVRQGQRWLDEGRPELAILSIERALSAEPRNFDALLLGARIEAARNNRTSSAAYAARLRTAGAPPDLQAAADAALRVSNIDHAAIEAARRLAREGHGEEAVAHYRSIFGQGEPPPPYAREYYQTLAATEAGRSAGQRGLAQLAAQPGADDRTLLANAEALTYAPSTRADGISRLATLTARSSVAADARTAWKQALTFYGNDPAAAALLEAYLQKYPDDTEMSQQLQAAKTAQSAVSSDPGAALRQSGFAALNAGSLRNSEERFEAALAANPASADALGGLGIVRLRQNRPTDARDLLERAIAADPAQADQWKRALEGASYSEELTSSRALLRRGDVAGADVLLRRAVRRDVEDVTDAESMLGEAALKRGDPAEAEQHFRAALARRPGFATAVAGLNQALRAEGRLTEAPVQPRAVASGAGSTGSAAADQLRAEAGRTEDLTSKAALLNSAMAAAPDDPWIRVDLARALRGLGRGAEGRALVEELAARQPTPESNYAAALIAQEDGRLVDAAAYMDRIPSQRLSADMGRMEARLRTQVAVARAASQLTTAPGVARQQLLALAAHVDPTGATAADAIRALGRAGDRVGAGEAARVAEAANPLPSARIAIAGALLAAGLDSEATAVADRLEASPLTPAQRRNVAVLRVGSAVRVSDRLNEAGNQGGGFEQLRPALTSQPDDPNVQLALSRLYQGARQPAEALRIAEAVLERDPGNFDARRGAVDAAIAMGDRRRADALAAGGVAAAPGDSRATLLQARVARAFGDLTKARVLLAEAARQREAELGTSAGGVNTLPDSLPNPFAPSGGVGGALKEQAASADAVSHEISQELATVHDEAEPRASGTIVVRSRSGTAGLDQLQEVAAPLEASFAPNALNGRITATVTPTLLDAGQLGGSTNALRFGTNAASGTLVTPTATTQLGAGLKVKYQLGDTISVDAGTSPLGFPVTNLLGGVEVAPKLSQSVTLRLRGERRSVLDSMVSYAGERDPVSGTTWGGVTQTGGHAQLETGLGAGYAYAGGGYAVYEGQHVAHNAKAEAGAGFAYPVLKQGDSTLMAGLNLVYFRFDNNQRGFTLGQGGYFSPQSFVAVNLPVDYRSTLGDLRYHLGATVGYAAFNEEASNLYPADPNLQAAAEAAALVDPLVPTHNVAQNRTGFVGGVRVDLDYPFTDTLSLNGVLTYDQAADWQETQVSVRLQQRF